MGRAEWTWNRKVPLTFFASLLILTLVAAILIAEVRPTTRIRVDWPLVVVGFLLVAGVLAVLEGMLFPVGLAVDDRGVRLAYLHRRELIEWPLVLRLEYHVDFSVSIETSLRSISLGVPGNAFLAPLVRELRRRKRLIRTPMPEEYPEPEFSLPPAF